MLNIKACLFDLDGVIVDTAKYHFVAWKRLANELGIDFTKKENEQLKGVSRKDSLELILKWGGVELPNEEKEALMKKKNDWYLEYILKMSSAEILPGITEFLDALQGKGIKIGLGSASKNATMILEQIDLIEYFEVIIDGNKVVNGKPHPEVFLKGAAGLGVLPAQCVVFEDAEKGIEAAKEGGMMAIGVGEEGSLIHAHHVIQNFENFQFDQLIKILKDKTQAINN